MLEYVRENGAIRTKGTSIPVMAEYDVGVVGGGMAGVGAALAAAKAGKKTVVVENTSALGGLATMGIVNIPMDFVSGLGAEFFKELEAMGGFQPRRA